jgi:hypothetical protein
MLSLLVIFCLLLYCARAVSRAAVLLALFHVLLYCARAVSRPAPVQLAARLHLKVIARGTQHCMGAQSVRLALRSPLRSLK